MKTKVGDYVRVCHATPTKAYVCYSINRVESIWRGMVGIREFQFMRKLNYYRSWVRVPGELVAAINRDDRNRLKSLSESGKP